MVDIGISGDQMFACLGSCRVADRGRGDCFDCDGDVSECIVGGSC